MPSPKPIKLTPGVNPNPEFEPQEFTVVGPGAVDQQAAIANISTADATDAATAVTLANATKAKVNAILVALRAAGVIAE